VTCYRYKVLLNYELQVLLRRALTSGGAGAVSGLKFWSFSAASGVNPPSPLAAAAGLNS